VRHENPKAEELAQVTRSVSRAFLDTEMKRGITGKTWNDTLKLLRATFKYLLPVGGINPFAGTPTRETETVFRQPFSPEELAAISEAARADEFTRPIIIVGICTAMRPRRLLPAGLEGRGSAETVHHGEDSKTGPDGEHPHFPDAL